MYIIYYDYDVLISDSEQYVLQVQGAVHALMVEEPAPSDDSSSYSMTLSEFEEDRWYNPTPLSDDAAEIESVQRLIKYVRVRYKRRIIARLYHSIIRITISFGTVTLYVRISSVICSGRNRPEPQSHLYSACTTAFEFQT